MIQSPETLLLRIRAETLRLNLKRAHANFENLPSLVKQFEGLQRNLGGIRDELLSLSEKMSKLRADVLRTNTVQVTEVIEAHNRVDGFVGSLARALEDLTALGTKSFLNRVGSMGKTIWESFEERARELQRAVTAIEGNLSGATAWATLGRTEQDAQERVFNESIELLGGMALRDTRLDADICELADAFLHSIRASGSSRSVIPGGVSSMMMTLESIVRLRFPEWTVWALPFVPCELWLVSAHKSFDRSLARALGSAASDKLLKLCLADAFATYITGPAYAYAALTLLLDPACAKDEHRVSAMFDMLRHMDPAGEGSQTESYPSLADELREAWEAAKKQVEKRADATPAVPAEAAVAADATAAVPVEAAVAADAAPAIPVETAVATLFAELKPRGYSGFGVEEWKAMKEWSKQLVKGEVGAIKIEAHHDLRHVLNAAWLARLELDRPKDISQSAKDLADRVRAEMAKRPPNDAAAPRRGLP